MRHLITLASRLNEVKASEVPQAKLDFAAIEVHRIPRGASGDTYLFEVPLADGRGSVSICVNTDGHSLEFTDIQARDMEDHPSAFHTTNQEWDTYQLGVNLGTLQTRQLLRHMLVTVRKDHPGVSTLNADRRTGLRYATGNTDVALNLPKT